MCYFLHVIKITYEVVIVNIERAYWTLQELAKQQGVTVAEVMADIDECINEAIVTIKRNNNQEVMERWKKIPCIGEIPTAVEFVAYLGEELIKEMHGLGNIVTEPINKQISS